LSGLSDRFADLAIGAPSIVVEVVGKSVVEVVVVVVVVVVVPELLPAL
jgi:hypothetical protein